MMPSGGPILAGVTLGDGFPNAAYFAQGMGECRGIAGAPPPGPRGTPPSRSPCSGRRTERGASRATVDGRRARSGGDRPTMNARVQHQGEEVALAGFLPQLLPWQETCRDRRSAYAVPILIGITVAEGGLISCNTRSSSFSCSGLASTNCPSPSKSAESSAS